MEDADRASPNPTPSPTANDSYVAHCPTWEVAPPVNAAPGQPPQIKARFLILSGALYGHSCHLYNPRLHVADVFLWFHLPPASRDGRLKLHKAKQNSNGTFSIGKTWPLEQLSQIEVAKVRLRRTGGSRDQTWD